MWGMNRVLHADTVMTVEAEVRVPFATAQLARFQRDASRPTKSCIRKEPTGSICA